MSCQLPTDCLIEIFEYLKDDKVSLYACLLVNRHWCESSVKILWNNIWNFKYTVSHEHQLKVDSAMISTLFACLPNESKELLNENDVKTPTSNPPLFNYA